MPETARNLNRKDAACLFLWLLIELAACAFLSHGRQFWSDEVFGWVVATDPSFHHMLYAWRSGADGGGIFFYLAARAWMLLFGKSAFTLRLFTAFGMWLALALTWITARRWYRLEIVAFCLPFCWLTAHSLLRQLMIGRFYGMLLAATAGAIYCYAIAADRPRPGRWLLAAFFAVHCLLVGTHPFGLLYSGLILAATIALDATRHTWRPRLYLAVLAGWCILWPSRFALRASAAVARPHFWTIIPTFSDLVDALSFSTDELKGLWAFLLLAVTAYTFFRFKQKPNALDTPAWMAGWTLMAAIPTVWQLSLHGTSYFVDRYLLPSLIGAALLQCAALHRLIPSGHRRWVTWSLSIAACITSAASVYSFFKDMPPFAEPPHAYTDSEASLLPPNLPVVVDRVDIFAEATAARPDRQWRYLLDWDTAMLSESPRGDVSGYHEMENWRNAGYHADAIQTSDTFLSRQSEFLVISDPSELWFTRRVQNNPLFQTRKLGTFSREGHIESVWFVQRMHP